MARQHLYVCETCVRDRVPAPGERPRGRRLADALADEMARRPELAERLVLRRVHCLNACLSPCSIALRGPGKASLRFSRLEPHDAAAVAELAERYDRSSDGDLPAEAWPAALAGKRTARTPPLRPRSG